MKKALIVIDVQNEYFPGGKLELWDLDRTLKNTIAHIETARNVGTPVILIQHEYENEAPFFQKDSEGAKIHGKVLAAAGQDTPIIKKSFADSFHQTNLSEVLKEFKAEHLLICGMMTQNCVAFTSLSPETQNFSKVTVLGDACTTFNELTHSLALDGLSTSREVVSES